MSKVGTTHTEGRSCRVQVVRSQRFRLRQVRGLVFGVGARDEIYENKRKANRTRDGGRLVSMEAEQRRTTITFRKASARLERAGRRSLGRRRTRFGAVCFDSSKIHTTESSTGQNWIRQTFTEIPYNGATSEGRQLIHPTPISEFLCVPPSLEWLRRLTKKKKNKNRNFQQSWLSTLGHLLETPVDHVGVQGSQIVLQRRCELGLQRLGVVGRVPRGRD